MKTNCQSHRGRGFTLIEMIGVLAILAVLAAMVAPSVVRQMVLAKGSREDRTLEELAGGLVKYVQLHQSVPGGGNWATNIASVLGLNATEVFLVDADKPATQRVYLWHPGFAPSTGTDPVYLQGTGGTMTTPVHNRILLLSSTHPSLSLPVATGAATSANAFDTLWNWTLNAQTKTPPSGWPAAWNGNADHLHLQRINLAGQFHRATFSNTAFPDNIPFAKFNGQSTHAFSETNAIDRYFLGGTEVRLFKHDDPFLSVPSAPDELDLTHLIHGDVNFLYDEDRWRIP